MLAQRERERGKSFSGYSFMACILGGDWGAWKTMKYLSWKDEWHRQGEGTKL